MVYTRPEKGHVTVCRNDSHVFATDVGHHPGYGTVLQFPNVTVVMFVVWCQ